MCHIETTTKIATPSIHLTSKTVAASHHHDCHPFNTPPLEDCCSFTPRWLPPLQCTSSRRLLQIYSMMIATPLMHLISKTVAASHHDDCHLFNTLNFKNCCSFTPRWLVPLQYTSSRRLLHLHSTMIVTHSCFQFGNDDLSWHLLEYVKSRQPPTHAFIKSWLPTTSVFTRTFILNNNEYINVNESFIQFIEVSVCVCLSCFHTLVIYKVTCLQKITQGNSTQNNILDAKVHEKKILYYFLRRQKIGSGIKLHLLCWSRCFQLGLSG